MTEPGRFRAHARHSVEARVSLWHPRLGWTTAVHLVNVGLAGACVALDGRLATGERVTIALGVPAGDAPPLSLGGRVAWTGAGRAGVAFDAVDASLAYALFERMRSLQRAG